MCTFWKQQAKHSWYVGCFFLPDFNKSCLAHAIFASLDGSRVRTAVLDLICCVIVTGLRPAVQLAKAGALESRGESCGPQEGVQV